MSEEWNLSKKGTSPNFNHQALERFNQTGPGQTTSSEIIVQVRVRRIWRVLRKSLNDLLNDFEFGILSVRQDVACSKKGWSWIGTFNVQIDKRISRIFLKNDATVPETLCRKASRWRCPRTQNSRRLWNINNFVTFFVE